jgi:hypothetical protein
VDATHSREASRSTRATAWIVGALVVAGCAVPMPVNELADPPPCADEAVGVAVAAWSEILGLPLVVDPPPFRWFEGECLDYQDGEPPCELGRSFIWLYYRDEEIHGIATEWRTVIPHEILHWALGLWGDVDPEHDLPAWSVVGDVEAMIDDLGTGDQECESE